VNLKQTPACGLVAILALSAGAAQPTRAAEWDAKHVKTEVPKTVAADQVFVAKVTMKNTGTETWKEARGIVPPSLRSQSPPDNKTWGTDFIILGQGKTVGPGQEFTFQSNLRAPAEPGKYAFQWRLHGKPGHFGEATAKVEVTVEKRKDAAHKPPAVPPADKSGKRPLTFDDFAYLGSFKLPERAGKGGAGFSESGLALRKSSDGSRRLLLNYTHPEQVLFEVEVPALAKFEKGNAAPLKAAAVKRQWAGLGNKDATPNGGFWWDDDKKVLYWTYYHPYWAGGDLPVLNATKLDDDKATRVGSWTVPQQKWHWGGVTRLPKSFADAYTGGKRLALGFGGYYSVAAPCSRGPALSAIADPDPAKGKVEGQVNLLGYPERTPAPRPGDYFDANAGFWSDPPHGREVGTWTYGDHCRAGVLIDLPDRQGFIAFAKLGTGRLGYDYGAITNAGEAQYWYFYDARHLGEVAKGARKGDAVVPYLTKPDAGMGGIATGACFDEEERKLYVIRMQSYPVGREHHPLVHVYRVKK
jgi:hypothetical protein